MSRLVAISNRVAAPKRGKASGGLAVGLLGALQDHGGVWFGWSGLIGCMIGAFIGGAFVEGLGFLGIFESVCALIIYLINWTLIPKGAAETNSKGKLAVMLAVLGVSLAAGTSYILYQYTILPQLFTADVAFAVWVPTFLLNLPIVLIACPALIRTISPKMRTWGMYTGNFREWMARSRN